jgi:hypothetical protein
MDSVWQMSQSARDFFSAGGEDSEGEVGWPLQPLRAYSPHGSQQPSAARNQPYGQQQQCSSGSRGGGGSAAQVGLAEDWADLMGSRVTEVPLTLSLQLGQAYTKEVEWWSKLGAAVVSALQQEWGAIRGASVPLRVGGNGSPAVLASSIKGGLCTCTIHVLLAEEVAQALRAHMAAGLGGVWVVAEGAPKAVLAHVHEDMNAPTYLFTLATRKHSYSPAGLQRFIARRQQQLFKGMRVLWLGSVDQTAQFIEQRKAADGEVLPQCRCPISLPPMTVVGLAVGGQKALRKPVEVRFGEAVEVFSFRRIPNRVRHLARVDMAEATSTIPQPTPSRTFQHTSDEGESSSSAQQQREQQRGGSQQQEQRGQSSVVQQQQQQQGRVDAQQQQPASVAGKAKKGMKPPKPQQVVEGAAKKRAEREAAAVAVVMAAAAAAVPSRVQPQREAKKAANKKLAEA